jgi:hypothetical protein
VNSSSSSNSIIIIIIICNKIEQKPLLSRIAETLLVRMHLADDETVQ